MRDYSLETYQTPRSRFCEMYETPRLSKPHGVQFVNGAQVTKQHLGPSVKAKPIDILLAPVMEPEMVDAI